jgi:uncharacterized protein YutE (UPF0331/DUF86 family)
MKNRYLQKLNELKDRIDFIEARLTWKEEFLSNRILRKAIYKEFQECVEIVFDLVSMIARDEGFFSEDDCTNLERIKEKIGIDEKTTLNLKKAKGLRNVLVHVYDGIIDSLAFDSIKKFLPAIKKFHAGVSKWIKKKK